MSVTTFVPGEEYSKKTQGLYFEDPVLSVLKNSKKLRRKGAQILVLLLNAKGNHSDTANFVKRLPYKGVDIIFSTSSLGKNYSQNGIKILSDKGHGQFLNYIEVVYDIDSNKIVERKTKLIQAIKLCQNFYSVTNDCYTQEDNNTYKRIDEILKKNNKLIPARFLNIEINI